MKRLVPLLLMIALPLVLAAVLLLNFRDTSAIGIIGSPFSAQHKTNSALRR